MIQQQAFAADNRMLKGALHAHTVRSDGKLTPEEVIRLHKAFGYDFLAITDHRKYNYRNFTNDEDIIIVPGMEFDTGYVKVEGSGARCFHTICLGPSREDGNGFRQDECVPSVNAPTQEAYQPYLDEIHAKNNLTMYCHPEWSATPARYFDRLRGNFAMEIWNSSTVIENDMDKDAAYWDELLGQGQRIFGAATDDGHLLGDFCNGWVMVNAKKELNAILQALKEGAFYSSCGPEIRDFYVDGDTAVIDCSPVEKARLHCDAHPTKVIRSSEGELTHAEFSLKHKRGPYPYVRISVIDKDGKYAWTNPIFLDRR